MLVEIQIDVPVSRAFEVISDIPNAANFIQAITKIEMLNAGPIGVGTRWRETRLMFGKEATEVMELTKFDQPNGYTAEVNSCGCHYQSDFTFRPSDNGTLVAMKFTVKPLTLYAKLMSPVSFLMNSVMMKCLKKDLQDCKTYCESRSPS